MCDIWQLGIESSAPLASLVLLRGGEVVAEREIQATQNHSAVLVAPLAEVLGELPDEAKLTEVVVATGPGSYNGARVGIAAGQGIALVHECPVVGIPSLEAVEEVRSGRPCLAVGDARRGSFFTIALSEGRVRSEPELMDREQFENRLVQAISEGQWIFSFEDPKRLALSAGLAEAVSLAVPSARFALEAWRSKSSAERERIYATPPQPYYLRPPHITQPKKIASPR